MERATWENYTMEVFKENAEVVLQFFKEDLPIGKVFKNENEYLNKISGILIEYCALLEEQEGDFWYNRAMTLQHENKRKNDRVIVHKTNNILYIIRILLEEKEKMGIQEGGWKEFKIRLDLMDKIAEEEEEKRREAFFNAKFPENLNDESETLEDFLDRMEAIRRDW